MYAVVVATARKILESKMGEERRFEINDTNKGVLKALCFYFSRDPGFASLGKGWNLNKGLLLSGGVGVGKTILMRSLTWNPLLPFRVVSVRFIADNYEKFGSETVNCYAYPEENRSISAQARYIGACFDDLGTEDTEKSHYGNKTNVMEKVILNRYDNCAHTLTHFTTNLTGEQIRELYGVRAVDRLREMINIIDFPKGSKSFRR